jgi:hypothetical protein
MYSRYKRFRTRWVKQHSSSLQWEHFVRIQHGNKYMLIKFLSCGTQNIFTYMYDLHADDNKGFMPSHHAIGFYFDFILYSLELESWFWTFLNAVLFRFSYLVKWMNKMNRSTMSHLNLHAVKITFSYTWTTKTKFTTLILLRTGFTQQKDDSFT